MATVQRMVCRHFPHLVPIKLQNKAERMNKRTPELAIVEGNTLAAIGLKSLLESAMPTVKVTMFGTFGEFEANVPEHFMHYFVSMHTVLTHRNFFIDSKHRHRTIVLTPSCDPNSQLNDFHCLCVNVRIQPHQGTSQPTAHGPSPRRASSHEFSIHTGENAFRQGERCFRSWPKATSTKK